MLKPALFEFKFETVVVNKTELLKEIEDLLWKMKHTWPVILVNDPKWVKQKTDEAWIKIGDGHRRQAMTFIEKAPEEETDEEEVA